MKRIAQCLFAASMVALLAGCASKSAGSKASDAAPIDSISCVMQGAEAGFKGTCEVTCSVNALAVNFDGLEPKRACPGGSVRTVQVAIAKTAIAGKWLGTMQGVQPEDPTRFEVVANASGKGSVGRTPFGWFDIIEMKEASCVITAKAAPGRRTAM